MYVFPIQQFLMHNQQFYNVQIILRVIAVLLLYCCGVSWFYKKIQIQLQ